MIPAPPTADSLPDGYRMVAGMGSATVLPDIDFETYSEAGYVWSDAEGKWRALPGAPGERKGLEVVGAAVYAQHPSTEVLSCAYDMKDGRGPRLWVPGNSPPVELFAHVAAGGLLEAWNSSFEHWIWNYVCTRRYGWPPLPLGQLRCAMAKARAHALPGSLDAAGKVVDARVRKDPEGRRLLGKYSVPRNPTKHRPERRVRPDITDPDTISLYRYNRQDIAAEAELSAQCPDLGGDELAFWLADQRVNYRGVAVDMEGVQNCIAIIDEAHARGNAELHALTGGSVARASEVARLQAWLHGLSVHLDSLDEEAVESALRLELPPVARRALEIRAAIGSAAVKKTYAMRNQCALDGRLHDLFSYHAARTGRATGNGPQPTNLPNSGPDVVRCPCGHYHKPEALKCPWCGCIKLPEVKLLEWNAEAAEDALAIIATRSLDAVEWFFGSPMAVVSACLRALFVAAPGCDLIGSDYSSIEAVVLAALAGEEWRLDVFRTHGRIYEVTAAAITGVPFEEDKRHPHRKLGKVGELASGYQGWIGAWIAFGADEFMIEEEIKQAILKWRAASPRIVEFWGGQERNWQPERYGVEGAAINAVQYPGTEYHVPPSGVSFVCRGDVLYCRLPSGRYLAYHRPRLAPSERRPGTLSLSYEGWNTNPKNGPVGWIRIETWGGRLVENIVQAVARDILRGAILRLEAAGYSVVLHVYDEVVCEAPHGFGSVEEVERLMTPTEDWARGWPVKASGGWRGRRYRK